MEIDYNTAMASIGLFLLGVLYAMFGVGTATAIAKFKAREIRFVEIIAWPVVLIILAIFQDVD